MLQINGPRVLDYPVASISHMAYDSFTRISLYFIGDNRGCIIEIYICPLFIPYRSIFIISFQV